MARLFTLLLFLSISCFAATDPQAAEGEKKDQFLYGGMDRMTNGELRDAWGGFTPAMREYMLRGGDGGLSDTQLQKLWGALDPNARREALQADPSLIDRLSSDQRRALLNDPSTSIPPTARTTPPTTTARTTPPGSTPPGGNQPPRNQPPRNQPPGGGGGGGGNNQPPQNKQTPTATAAAGGGGGGGGDSVSDSGSSKSGVTAAAVPQPTAPDLSFVTKMIAGGVADPDLKGVAGASAAIATGPSGTSLASAGPGLGVVNLNGIGAALGILKLGPSSEGAPAVVAANAGTGAGGILNLPGGSNVGHAAVPSDRLLTSLESGDSLAPALLNSPAAGSSPRARFLLEGHTDAVIAVGNRSSTSSSGGRVRVINNLYESNYDSSSVTSVRSAGGVSTDFDPSQISGGSGHRGGQ